MKPGSPPTIGWLAHTSSASAILSRWGANTAGMPSRSAVNRPTAHPAINLPVFINCCFTSASLSLIGLSPIEWRAFTRRQAATWYLGGRYMAIPMGSLIWSRFL